MSEDMAAKVHDLAVRYFGEDTETNQAKVLETAFKMRYLWSFLVREGQRETEEADTVWEFVQPSVSDDNNSRIQNWLFRR
ncbi:MAG: hypothetical protein ABH934_00275 [Chloroflexota bacterium]